MTVMSTKAVRWRAHGSYLLRLASKTSLLEETRQFLLTYARFNDVHATRQALIDGGLPQSARATRLTIVEIIQIRLTQWNPPSWVLDDLITFAKSDDLSELRAVLLLHTARQDELLYDFAQQVIVSHWQCGDYNLLRADIQKFMDIAQAGHPEITGWSHSTREKLSQNALTVLRDFGLLKGKRHKRIVEPTIPLTVVRHLVRLLNEEGIGSEDIPQHPDWQLWLWDADRVRKVLAT